MPFLFRSIDPDWVSSKALIRWSRNDKLFSIKNLKQKYDEWQKYGEACLKQKLLSNYSYIISSNYLDGEHHRNVCAKMEEESRIQPYSNSKSLCYIWPLLQFHVTYI